MKKKKEEEEKKEKAGERKKAGVAFPLVTLASLYLSPLPSRPARWLSLVCGACLTCSGVCVLLDHHRRPWRRPAAWARHRRLVSPAPSPLLGCNMRLPTLQPLLHAQFSLLSAFFLLPPSSLRPFPSSLRETRTRCARRRTGARRAEGNSWHSTQTHHKGAGRGSPPSAGACASAPRHAAERDVGTCDAADWRRIRPQRRGGIEATGGWRPEGLVRERNTLLSVYIVCL